MPETTGQFFDRCRMSMKARAIPLMVMPEGRAEQCRREAEAAAAAAEEVEASPLFLLGGHDHDTGTTISPSSHPGSSTSLADPSHRRSSVSPSPLPPAIKAEPVHRSSASVAAAAAAATSGSATASPPENEGAASMRVSKPVSAARASPPAAVPAPAPPPKYQGCNLLPSGNKACSRVYHTPCADLAQPPVSHWACSHCIAATPATTTTSDATSICAPSAASSVYHSYGEGKPRTPELPQQWQHHQASAPTASAFLLTPPDSVIRTTEQHAAAKAGLAMEQAHGVAVEIAAVMSHREGGDGGSVKSNARKESLVRMAPKVLQLAVSPVKNAKLESGSADDGSWFARNKLRIEHAATSATTLDVGNSLISAASFTASAAAPAAASTATSPPALQLTPRKKAAVETMLNLTTTPSVPLEGSLAKAVAVGNVEDSLGESSYRSSSAALRSEQPAIKVEDVRIFAEAEVEVDEIRHMLSHSSTSADVDGCKGNAAVNIDLVAAETILNLTTSMGLQQNSANNNLGSAEQAVKKVKVALTATSTATPTSEKGKEGRATKYVRGVNGRYECPHCYLTFSTSHGVDRHVERNCSTLFPNKWDSFSIQNPPAVTKTRQRVACPHCSSDFTNNDSMTRHIEKSCPELFPDKKKQKASKQDH
eukprot:gene8298-22659_t